MTWRSEPLPSGAGEDPRIQFFSPLSGMLVSAGPQGVIGHLFYTTADGGRPGRPSRRAAPSPSRGPVSLRQRSDRVCLGRRHRRAGIVTARHVPDHRLRPDLGRVHAAPGRRLTRPRSSGSGIPSHSPSCWPTRSAHSAPRSNAASATSTSSGSVRDRQQDAGSGGCLDAVVGPRCLLQRQRTFTGIDGTPSMAAAVRSAGACRGPQRDRRRRDPARPVRPARPGRRTAADRTPRRGPARRPPPGLPGELRRADLAGEPMPRWAGEADPAAHAYWTGADTPSKARPSTISPPRPCLAPKSTTSASSWTPSRSATPSPTCRFRRRPAPCRRPGVRAGQ